MISEEMKHVLDNHGLTIKWYKQWADKWELVTEQIKYQLDHDVKYKHDVMDIFHVG